MLRDIQKVFIASLNVFKLFSTCAKFQVNKWQFSSQKKYGGLFIRNFIRNLWGIATKTEEMFTDTYLGHHVLHYIAKSLKVYDMW